MLIISITIIGTAFFQLFSISGPFPAILGKSPWPKLGKMIDLASKLGENNDIEHYKGSKIYPQNQIFGSNHKLPRSGKKFWKMKKFPGQGKVREQHFQSGKFKKNKKKSGNFKFFLKRC